MLVSYQLANVTFMTIRLAEALSSSNPAYGQIFMNIANIITWSATVLLHVTTGLYGPDIVSLINPMLHLDKKLGRK